MKEDPPAHEALVQATLQLADRHAVLVSEWLVRAGHVPGTVLTLPAMFLIELAAVLQLAEWERLELPSIDAALPSYREAARALATRGLRGKSEFEGPQSARLSDLVNSVWLSRFAWDGPSMLDSDIIFGIADQNALADKVAQFLWENRVFLTSIGESNNVSDAA